MNCNSVKSQIVKWLSAGNYKGFVIGISGGIDSSLVSTLCAETGLPTICVSMPIHQPKSHLERAHDHINWLKSKYVNVKSFEIDLTVSFDTFISQFPVEGISDLACVNARSRLRMVSLYMFANANGYIVAGTGNKVEDYGVGFFTKYGDGGVDISPIGDLLKTEVVELSAFLGIINSILKAKPTDGLWEDDRSDEDQIGATYPELEWAMKFYDKHYSDGISFEEYKNLNERERKVLDIYIQRHESSVHKMKMPPVCSLIKDDIYND